MFLSSDELEKTKENGTKFLVIICATIIAVGAMLLIVGFIGCCGAVYENQCLLGTVRINRIKNYYFGKN